MINIFCSKNKIEILKKRSFLISKIRKFFFNRNILEIDTPSLSNRTVTDINISSFHTKFYDYKNNKTLYLITSPEFHMKRLLSLNIGAIYQICKCFRNNEKGRYHSPEFSMIEWYRPSYNIYDMMNEVNELIKYVLKCKDADTVSYKDIFIDFLNIDPISSNIIQLIKILKKFKLNHLLLKSEIYKDNILQILFLSVIEPNIGKEKPIFIYHFPASQAALSKINKYDSSISERFELYYKNMELANGFDELIDSNEQKKRFDLDNIKRKKLGLPIQKIDFYFLDALKKNKMPQCSGVALGLDRLLMLALNANHIDEVLSFPLTNC